MERYEKPVMTLEEIEDEVLTIDAAAPNRVPAVSELNITNNNIPGNANVPAP